MDATPRTSPAAQTLTMAICEKEEEKRARKRSRYLSPPYTNDILYSQEQVELKKEKKKKKKEEKAMSMALGAIELAACNVVDMLSALHAAALLDLPDDEEPLLSFFAMHRTTPGFLLAKPKVDGTSSIAAPAPPSATNAAGGAAPVQVEAHKSKEISFGGGNVANATVNPATNAAVNTATNAANAIVNPATNAANATVNPTTNAVAAAPKLPFTVIRKNLEIMISSLSRSTKDKDGAKPLAAHGLKGEMLGLLAKVDKVLSATTAQHHKPSS